MYFSINFILAIMTEKARIEKLIDTYDLSSGQFAQEIGIQNSTLSHIINGRNRPSLDVIKKILSRFPEIDPNWLIFGHGKMLRSDKQPINPGLFDQNQESIPAHKHAEPSTPKTVQPEASTVQQSVRSIDPPPYHRATQPIYVEGLGTVQSVLPSASKTVTKIILYYSDLTFEEFHSK